MVRILFCSRVIRIEFDANGTYGLYFGTADKIHLDQVLSAKPPSSHIAGCR